MLQWEEKISTRNRWRILIPYDENVLKETEMGKLWNYNFDLTFSYNLSYVCFDFIYHLEYALKKPKFNNWVKNIDELITVVINGKY